MTIKLDADSIRTELYVYPEGYDITQDQVSQIEKMPDEIIQSIINQEVDDVFWEAYDSVRRQVINRLITATLNPTTDEQ